MASIEEVLNYQIMEKCPLEHGSEAAWAVWAAIFLNIPLNTSAALALSQIRDPIAILLSLDAFHSGLIPNGLDTTLWETFMTKEELYGEHWLVSYEANYKGWLPSAPQDHVASDSNFGFLKNAGVYFYDERKARTGVPTGASAGIGTAPLFSFAE